MGKSPKRAAKLRSPFLYRLARGLYIALFILSLIVVVGFAAVNIFAPEPEVDSQVTINPNRPTDPSVPPVGTGQPDSSPEPTSDELVLNRRDGVFTCLLLGVADQGGTDTIMLGVFDTNAKQASLISIPRDTAVIYEGRKVKINAAYSYGGVEAVSSCVSSLLAVPIDYYMSVNTRAFRDIVNEIGGVDFYVPVDMYYNDPYGDIAINIKAGYHHLNGKQAEGVVRCRNCYANADIGRAATQRAFLTALVKQTITLSNVTKVTNLINILNTYVDSDMPLNVMVHFGTQAIGMDLEADLASAALPGIWPSVQDPYYYLYEDETLELVNSLGIYEEEVPIEVLQLLPQGY